MSQSITVNDLCASLGISYFLEKMMMMTTRWSLRAKRASDEIILSLLALLHSSRRLQVQALQRWAINTRTCTGLPVYAAAVVKSLSLAVC